MNKRVKRLLRPFVYGTLSPKTVQSLRFQWWYLTSYVPRMLSSGVRTPRVRYFGTTAFWLFYEIPASRMETYLSLWAKRILEATAGTEAEPMGWVQAFGIPAGREPEVEHAIEILCNAGVTTIAVWSYLACVAMSGLAPADPAAVWAAVERGFASVAGAG